MRSAIGYAAVLMLAAATAGEAQEAQRRLTLEARGGFNVPTFDISDAVDGGPSVGVGLGYQLSPKVWLLGDFDAGFHSGTTITGAAEGPDANVYHYIAKVGYSVVPEGTSPWSVILYKAVSAWYLIILVRFFEEIPKELLEAAELDGANPFQTFFLVVLPLAKPALATIALFYFVLHWNEFFRSMIYLNDQTKWPLQVVLRQFVIEGDKVAIVGANNANNNIGLAQINIRALKAGMILITILPILAIYPLILKFFTKGTMSGALKG